MADRWEKTDIVAKLLLSLVGLVLSGAIAYRGWTEDEQRHLEARRESLKEEFRTFYSFVREADQKTRTARSDADLASTAAQSLSQEFGIGIYLAAINQLKLDQISQSPGPGPATGSPRQIAAEVTQRAAEFRAVNLQVRESGAGPQAAKNKTRWFAVIGSYPLNASGRREADAKAAKARALGRCAEIWATKISRNYAVVLGGVAPRDVALATAQIARRTGLAPDAFTQADREWEKIGGGC